jgi:DNA modification methylase
MNYIPLQLTIVYRSIKTLIPYANNARKHSKAQISKLITALKAYGWTNPIIIDEHGTVLCGHGRLQAANEMGLTEVPTIQLSHMTDAQKRAYIIADNRIAEQGSWSKTLLRSELQGLIDVGYEAELTGFDTLEIDTLLNLDDPGDKVDDDVHLPDGRVPISQLGDLWHIGQHRLIVGDAREPLVYERLLAGERAQLVFTDPPYGCRVENNVSGNGRVKHGDFVEGATGVLDSGFSMGLLRPALKCIAVNCLPGAIAFVCIDWRGAPFLLDAVQGVFHETKNLIVWAKTNAGQGAFFRSQHELVYAFKVRPGKHINTFGLGGSGRHRSNIWTYAGANVFRAGRMQDLTDHPTVKPKKLVADAILDCSTRGSIVLDSFAGSGTTLVSAEMTGRRGYGIELDPKYADVIIRRVEEEVGAPALLDGVTPFGDVAVTRGVPTV